MYVSTSLKRVMQYIINNSSMFFFYLKSVNRWIIPSAFKRKTINKMIMNELKLIGIGCYFKSNGKLLIFPFGSDRI